MLTRLAVLLPVLAVAACAPQTAPPPLFSRPPGQQQTLAESYAVWRKLQDQYDPAVVQAQARAQLAADQRAQAVCAARGNMVGTGFHGFGWYGFANSIVAGARVQADCEALYRNHGVAPSY